MNDHQNNEISETKQNDSIIQKKNDLVSLCGDLCELGNNPGRAAA